MAKKAMVERELKRQKLVDKYAAKRAELKAKGDYIGLSKLPKNSAPARLHNRCSICLLYTSPSPRDKRQSRMPSSA